MRATLLGLIGLAVSASAAAQTPFALPPGAVLPGEYANQMELDRQRMVNLQNELNARDATRRADEAVRSLALPPLPSPPVRPQAEAGNGLAPTPAEIPDDRLAASNARVRAAAAVRR
jgi:hypothetical protein